MKQQYPTLVHEWFEEVWNQRNASAIDRLLEASAIIHGITKENGKELQGPEDFKEFHRRFLEAFPDIAVEVLDTVSEGDKIAGRCPVRGEHKGNALGFPATGRKTVITGMCFARVKAGKIVEAWNNFDFLTMYTQLGALDKVNQQPA